MAAPLGGSGGILKEKLIPFLKSPPLRTIELMYHMIFLRVFSIFAVMAAQAATAAPMGWSGGILKKMIPFLKSPLLKTIELMYDFFTLFFNFCRYGGGGGNGGALGRIWGYPKRKTDPIFEIPTVENHRIDILHDFFSFYSIFAVTAALAAAA